ncbi:UDP-N-acetylmuramate--L-alanine ligase [Oscillospiraceae bacterium MB08-C2-2]|nr:UDP-N-acetylmuramate--L-alanine ligase [Oscillospiraceae bacterium MB08-C2-2]
MENTVWQGVQHIHFIGIGGSGMFPIVQILKSRGYHITGSDNNPGDTIELERKMGIDVSIGHDPDNLSGADMVVYTAALMKDNPELVAAKERGIPTYERSAVLGYITEQYDDCICVSGTHGKTTTTAMLTQILVSAGLDPTAVIGGKLPLIGGNGRAGSSSIMTCEACEFVDTFLHLSPDISVILNVDADHLDYFGTLENIIKSFRKFAEKTTRLLIVNGDDANSLKAVEGLDKRTITFGLGEGNTYQARSIVREKGLHRFELWRAGEKLTDIALSVPGKHNVLNALAAAAAALEVGATPEQIAEHLFQFKGAGRRFEILGTKNGVTIADDYAHHPAELGVTLEVAQEMGYNKVWAVFQPFTYSRTALLLDDFARVLAIADRVVMSEIMGAREKNTYNIYTKDLADKIPGSVWYPGFEEMANYVMENASPGDLVLTLGCGDVYKCAKLMLK